MEDTGNIRVYAEQQTRHRTHARWRMFPSLRDAGATPFCGSVFALTRQRASNKLNRLSQTSPEQREG